MRRLLLAVLVAACTGDDARADLRYVGEARMPDGSTLLYEEHHLLRADADGPRDRLVLYRCVDGTLFARKRVEYGADPAAPTFALEDARFGYREGVRREAQALVAFVRRDRQARERNEPIAAAPSLVIDAGFDEFVRAHWERLQQGEALPLDFLVPSRLETLRFKLSRVAGATLGGEPASVFRLGLSGLLGLFAPSLEVSYRDRDRRLMRFAGLTNVRADRDENLSARIDFPPAREQTGVDPAEWQRALAEALAPCTPGG
jgi:hypothetical protein